MSKQGPSFCGFPNGSLVAITPAKRRAYMNESQEHFDPFDSDEDRWPGDKFQIYTYDGEHWIAVGATDNAIDDSGGV